MVNKENYILELYNNGLLEIPIDGHIIKYDGKELNQLVNYEGYLQFNLKKTVILFLGLFI